MQITMLGTGHAVVTECYNTCFVLSEGPDLFLVDGGGGSAILRQLKYAGFDWRTIHEIFVTHKHVDHLTGIIWLIRMICQSMARDAYEGEARIYAHDEVAAILQTISEQVFEPKETAFFRTRLRLTPVCDGEDRKILNRKVTFFDIHSTKTKQFGFCMDLGGGEKLTCCGDEPYHDEEREYAEGSKWLLHEAFCLHSEADVFQPYEKHHSTVKDACELAERMGVENLLLYHTEDTDLSNRKERYLAEGRQFYHGNLYIPDDLEVLTV